MRLPALVKKLLLALTIIALVSGGYFLYSFLGPRLFSKNSSLMVTTPGSSAIVLLNGKTVGRTPYKADKLKPGDYTVKIIADVPIGENTKKITWETKIILTSGARVVINQDLGPLNQISGEVLSSEIGDGISIISNPEEVEVQLDDKDLGKTPVFTQAVAGEHKLVLAKKGFLKRELKINTVKGLKLDISVNLALDILNEVELLNEDQSFKLYDLTRNVPLTPLEDWADSLFFAQEKYSTSSSKLDLIIDYKGATYSAYAKKLAEIKKATVSAQILIGYLGKEKGKLTDEAKKSLEETKKQLIPKAVARVEILSTPTGFLNVRVSPSVGAEIKAKVTPKETYDLLEETSGWFKIKLKDTEGWVSAQYARKIENK